MRVVYLVVALLMILAATVCADVTVTEKLSTSGMMGMARTEGTEVTYIKGDKIRTETTMSGPAVPGGSPQTTYTAIVRLDKGVMWYLDDAESTYFESNVGELFFGEESTQVSVKVKDLKTTDTGKEKVVAGYKCRGVKVELAFETEAGEKPVMTQASGMFWLAKEDKVTKELRDAWEKAIKISVANTRGQMKDFMEQMLSLSERLDGVPLAMEIEMGMDLGEADEAAEMEEAMRQMRKFAKQRGMEVEEGEDFGKITVKREVVSISTDKLDDSLFEIPKNYRKTSSIPIPVPMGK